MMKHLTWAWIGLMLACGGGRKDAEPDTATPPGSTSATTPAPAPADPHQKQLDTAVARHAAGRKAFDERDFPKAMLEAQRGLDALGVDFLGPHAAEETADKIKQAKERYDLGGPADGATVMLRMLSDRIELARSSWHLAR